jgi:hypothetical protein
MKKKKSKGGRPRKIKDAYRATWNVSGEDAVWVHEQAETRGITESEFIRDLLYTARNYSYAYTKAV